MFEGNQDQRIMQKNHTESIEERYIQDGSEVWINTVKTLVQNERGEVTGVLAQIHEGKNILQ